MTSILLLALYLVFSLPEIAHAYIDPASGNALVASLIALAGTFLYMCKSLFYKIINRLAINPSSNTAQITEKDSTVVIFSEGKTYWSTFRPIITELIKQKKYFRYITLDVHDPALLIDSKFMQSKLIYKTIRSFAKLAKIKAPVMLATTPNIGSPGYPIKRPPQVGNLVHVFHAMDNVAPYRKGSLDYYDAVLMIGDHEIKSIRTVESARQVRYSMRSQAVASCILAQIRTWRFPKPVGGSVQVRYPFVFRIQGF